MSEIRQVCEPPIDVASGPPESIDHDITSRSDIHDLVVAFYREVVFDDILEPMFGEVAEVDWALHIPKLIDYWCRVLLGQVGYSGALLASHAHVHSIEPLRAEHFDRWFALWVATIDSGWHGPTADMAKDHAAQIGAVMARRIAELEWQPRDGLAPELPGSRSPQGR